MERNSSSIAPEGQPGYRAVRQEIIKYSEFSVYFQISLFVYLLARIESWPIFVSLIPLSFYNFKQVLASGYVLKKEGNAFRKFKTSLSGLAFIQQSCDFSSKILMIFYLETGLSLFAVALMFGVPIVVKYFYLKAPYTLFQGYLHFWHIIIRLAIFLTLLLKSAEDLFEYPMSWANVWIPFMAVLILGGTLSSFLLFILLIMKFYKILYDEIVIKSNWGLFVCWICFSYSVLSFYYINSLDEKDTNLIVPTVLHNINGLAIAFWSLLKLRSFTEWGVEDNVEEQEEGEENIHQELDIVHPAEETPKFFERISTNFYKPVEQLQIKQKLKKNTAMAINSVGDEEIAEKFSASLPAQNSEEASVFIVEDICNSHTCLVCCEIPSDAVLLPCGHGGICFECSNSIKNRFKKCHICRIKIDQTVQIKQNSELAHVLPR